MLDVEQEALEEEKWGRSHGLQLLPLLRLHPSKVTSSKAALVELVM